MKDIIFSTLLFKITNDIKTQTFSDILGLIVILIFTVFITNKNILKYIYDKSDSLIKYYNNYNYITFKCEEHKSSLRFKAIMYFINKNNNKTITSVLEGPNMKWSNKIHDMVEDKNITWKINQLNSCEITKEISGSIKYYTKEQTENFTNKTLFLDINELTLYSKLSVKTMTMWVEECLDDYEKFIKSKCLDKQYIVDINYNSKISDIEYVYTPWVSNVTFDNRFFTNKNEIINKIKFFINNPDWYKQRGIPYTLGILLWGEPGCGKTGFIKALLNLTKRHGINIKLTNQFSMDALKDIIHDEEIGDDLIIPQDKRVLIFEDIDCMSDIIKDRDLIHGGNGNGGNANGNGNGVNANGNGNDRKKKNNTGDGNKKYEEDNINNLSYLLNILDGLQECHGRIIIMTTNKPEILDKALIRPGRIDYKINFTKAKNKDVTDILNFYWNVKRSYNFNIDNKYTHAEIINFCRTCKNIDETLKYLQ